MTQERTRERPARAKVAKDTYLWQTINQLRQWSSTESAHLCQTIRRFRRWNNTKTTHLCQTQANIDNEAVLTLLTFARQEARLCVLLADKVTVKVLNKRCCEVRVAVPEYLVQAIGNLCKKNASRRYVLASCFGPPIWTYSHVFLKGVVQEVQLQESTIEYGRHASAWEMW